MRRGVILTDFTLCSGGCGEVEMINPLLNRWLGFSAIVLADMSCHAQQYSGVHAFKLEISFLHSGCVRMTCLWVI
jgi:hypothetical protein